VADLVSYAELKAYLNLPDDSRETEITALLENIEGALEAQCDREGLPFQAAEAGRVEWHDGTGTIRLFLFYPISDVTEILVGRDAADPDDELDPDDVDEVVWDAGPDLFKITRTDGAKWPPHRAPRCIRVTYDAAAFLPELATLAVKRVAGAFVRQFGAEGYKSFKLLDAGGSLQRIMDETPEWTAAVNKYRRLVLF
jgi:hypothetical protein